MKFFIYLFFLLILPLSIFTYVYFYLDLSNILGYTAPNTVQISFPKDHASHDRYANEWWYLNTLLTTTEEVSKKEITKSYSQVISFSTIKNAFGTNSYLLTGSSGIDSKSFGFINTPGTVSAGLNSGLLNLEFNNSQTSLTLTELPGSRNLSKFALVGNIPYFGFVNLVFEQGPGYVKPNLWGEGENNICTGLITVFEPYDTFYYSIPGYVISGNVRRIDGKTVTVKGGIGWLDHQWFNTSNGLKNWKGHYWTSANFSLNPAVKYNNLDRKDLLASPILGSASVINFLKSGNNFYSIWRDERGNTTCSSKGDIQAVTKDFDGFPIKTLTDLGTYKIGHQAVTGTEFYDLGVGSSFVEYFSTVNLSRPNSKVIFGTGFVETSISNKIY